MSDHPQLTAYLLGELSPVESAALEAELAASPELQQELDALRQTIAALQSAFAQHVETQPAVPAIDREKLHALLRSAMVSGAVTRAVERTPTSVPPGPGGPGYGSTGYGSTVAAPALLVHSPRSPRSSTSRGWLLAGAVLVVGGLIGLSQWEVGHGEQTIAQVQSGLSDRDSLDRRSLAINNGRGGQPSHPVDNLATGSTTSPVAPTSDLAPLVAIIQQEPSGPMEAQDEGLSESITSMGRAVVRLSDGASPADAGLVVSNRPSPGIGPFDPGPRLNLNTVGRNNWRARTVNGMSAPGQFSGDLNIPFRQDSNASKAGVTPRYAAPTPDGAVDSYFLTLGGPTDFYKRTKGLAEKNGFMRPGDPAFGGRGTNPVPLGDTDGEFHFSDSPVRVLFDGLSDQPLDESRAKGRSLQRGEGIDNLSMESLKLAAPQGLSAADHPDASPRRRHAYLDLWGELPAAVEFDAVHDPIQPRIIIDSAPESEKEVLARSGSESKPELPQLQQALPQSLTVNDYEEGFTQLGKAVENWDRFSRGGQSRGTQPAQPKAPALADLDEVSYLNKLVTDQQTEFKSLREKTPGIEGKPLTEVAPEVAKNAELALLRVRRELAREQAVWYYREGYIRQLEATLAAAEQYAHVPENDFATPEAQPLSTFGIDVDTASYSNVRRFVEAGQLPPPDAVRIEELINSFQYEGPKVEGEHPLAVAAEVSVCPWQPQHQLLRVALKGKAIDLQQRPPARLVFLVDTSGSMSDENKLPLVKQSLRILVDQMREQDRLSIVTYSDNAGLLLDSTGGDKREAILAAIEGLHSDGSTNGEAGLKLAYEVAVKQFGEGATNRVMLCTDGDFNVGESSDSAMVKLIEKERQTGVFLNIFGFGSGNLKDAKLEAIADKGNGQYIYIDGIKEARKTLLNELTGTLYTIAKDVKLQIEFNPNLVGSYRLVGYENRVMAAKDFNNDKIDSGDMGAGHSVVALYEIVPPGAVQPVAPKAEVEPLKYGKKASGLGLRGSEVQPATETPVPASAPGVTPPTGLAAPPVGQPLGVFVPVADAAQAPADPLARELCTIRVRYKQPTSNESTKIETVVVDPSKERGGQLRVSRDHVWATAVAEFGLVTKHSSFVGTGNYSQILELAQSALGDDVTGQRREFITLVRQAQHLTLKHEARLAEISDHLEDHRQAIQQIKAVEKAPDLMTKASCSGKYKTLLRQIEAPDDQPSYGEFKDYGRWEGHEYKTLKNLPSGYWVYSAPHWYIWGESTEQAAVEPAK